MPDIYKEDRIAPYPSPELSDITHIDRGFTCNNQKVVITKLLNVAYFNLIVTLLFTYISKDINKYLQIRNASLRNLILVFPYNF